MDTIKEIFSDILDEVLQCKIEKYLGYEKYQLRNDGTKNFWNGSTQLLLKTQFGEVQVSVPRGRNGLYEPQILGKYQRNGDG